MADDSGLLEDFEKRFHGNAPAASDDDSHDNDSDNNPAWDYFSRLPDTLRRFRDPHANAERFETMWCQVSSIESPRRLALVLHNVAEELRDNRQAGRFEHGRFEKDCITAVRQNLHVWEAAATPALGEFSARNLSMSVWALATLSARPSENFSGRLQERSIEIMDRFTPRDLANTTWAMARLAIKPSPQFLAAWEKQAGNTTNTFEPRYLANSLWAMAVFNTIGAPDGERAAAARIDHEIAARIKRGFNFPDLRNRQQIVDARMQFHYLNELDTPEENDNHSRTEINLAALFRRVGLDVRPESGYIPLLRHQVDIPVVTSGGNIEVEVDGPPHFAFSSGTAGLEITPNGSTRLQTSLLRLADPNAHILRVSFRAAEKILDKRALAHRPLHDAVETTMKQPPGAYALRFNPAGLTGTASVEPFFPPGRN